MSIQAQVIADSICNSHRITTMKVVMPRIILAEFNTHRMLSKNSASSRAIPFKKMVEIVQNDPFIPIAWQKDHKGMQGTEYFTNPTDIANLCEAHLRARDSAVEYAEIQYHQGVTKQICNRYLEPFMWHTVLVTTTEWENFFHLRCPQYYYEPEDKYFRSKKDWSIYYEECFGSKCQLTNDFSHPQWLSINKGQAEIHMMALAEAMWDARQESKPKELKPGEWHIPYMSAGIDDDEVIALAFKYEKADTSKSLWEIVEPYFVKISTAMCAQTSYTTVGEDGRPTPYENLLDLHNSLLVRPYTNRKGVVFGPDDPIHTSPAEHCAQAMTEDEFYRFVKGEAVISGGDLVLEDDETHGWCHNLRGWKSYRSMIPNENRR